MLTWHSAALLEMPGLSQASCTRYAIHCCSILYILYSTAFIADLTLHLHVESHSTVTQLFHLCPPIDPAHLWLRSPDNRLYSVQSVAHALAPPYPPMAPPCPPLAPPCQRQAVHCSVSSSCSGSNAHLWLHPAHLWLHPAHFWFHPADYRLFSL